MSDKAMPAHDVVPCVTALRMVGRINADPAPPFHPIERT